MDRACLKGLMISISQRTVQSIDVIPQSQDVWLAGLVAALVVLKSVRKGQSWLAHSTRNWSQDILYAEEGPGLLVPWPVGRRCLKMTF